MNSVFSLRSTAVITLSTLLFSCASKIELTKPSALVQNTSGPKPHYVEEATFLSKAPLKEISLKKENSTVGEVEQPQMNVSTTKIKSSYSSSKKFLYESGYRPGIFKPRPFVPETKYTPYVITNETALTDSDVTIVLSSLVIVGGIGLALLIKRLI